MPASNAMPAEPSGDHTLELSDATLASLEFPQLVAVIAELASCDLGRERCLGLLPLADAEELERRRRHVEEAERLLAAQALVPSSETPFGPLLDALGDGGRDLGGPEIVVLGGLLRIALGAAERIAEADPPCPALDELAATLPAEAAELRRAIAKTLDARGEVREDASPKLAGLRGRIRKVRNDLYGELSTLVERHRDHLSEETIPMRGGRLVLVLSSGSRGRFPGLVHGRSGSGKSFYYEPIETVELNNELQQSVAEEEAERRRIVAELIERLTREMATVYAAAELVAELDRLQAAVRFRRASGGRLAAVSEDGDLVLREARHPLLDPGLQELRRAALGHAGHAGTVVPLDVELAEDERLLVVTGPNAGGKTVALKTVGLLTLAHLSALPIPVGKGSRVPGLEAVVATVGDDQDLLADRSTFSGRLLRLAEAWEAAGPRSLLLLDELGSGTDPEEGSALSVALVEALLERRCRAFVTTHLSQVAAAALEAEGAACAAMQFDSTSGEPTYRLLPGPPGGSEALALARRLGLPRPWIERAEELLGSEHRELRRLLAEVERTRAELAESHSRLEVELADAERLRERLAQREAELVAERKAVGSKLETKLESFRRETLEKMRAEVERLRSELETGRRKGLAARATERLFEEAPELAPEEEAPEGPLEVGARVRHRLLGWEGRLDKLDRGRAKVDVAGKSVRCSEGDLVPAPGSEKKSAEKKSRRPAFGLPREPKVSAPEAGEAASELKLIGQRVEPALDELDRYLDQALLAGHSEVRIVHGHGTGRLREAVRDHLRRHAGVAGQRKGKPNEGGNGATMVTLGGS